MISIFSRHIFTIPYLDNLLEEATQYVFFTKVVEIEKVAGWGRKPSADKARWYASQHNIPYISLEDGFLRSVGLGGESRAHSLIVDYLGVYYDSTQASDLENLILQKSFSKSELERSLTCINLIRQHRLSKYNQGIDDALFFDNDKQRILVVDQTYGDASVEFGGATEQSFIDMLDTAIIDNPSAEILVKIHPDVVAGKKQGYLLAEAEKRDCKILSDDISPWAVLDAVEHVYVVTSQLGFDALLAGKKVSCFGLPFYAGWGLTDDSLVCSRRGQLKSLEHVFFAAYIKYCRYLNPYTGNRCELEDTILLISDKKRILERFRGDWLAIGFSRWKRSFIANFLGRFANVGFLKKFDVDAGAEESNSICNVLYWASSVDSKVSSFGDEKELIFWRIEDGFIRSVGLGADLVAPISLVVDSQGIYYDASKASDLEIILNTYVFDNSLLLRAEKLRKQLIKLRLSKYNVGVSHDFKLSTTKVNILVVGQVETDASIRHGSPEIKTNLALLKEVRKRNPQSYIIYKPHPDVVSGGRYGELSDSVVSNLYDLELVDVSITDLLDKVDEVHTMSSLTGFEALLRGVKVVTYGLPFYAGWGLTNDNLACSRRTRVLSIDELVAATLIIYPIYCDPVSREVINVETAVKMIDLKKNDRHKVCLKTYVYKLIRNRFLRF